MSSSLLHDTGIISFLSRSLSITCTYMCSFHSFFLPLSGPSPCSDSELVGQFELGRTEEVGLTMLQFSNYPIGKEEDEVRLLKWAWFIKRGVVCWKEGYVDMYTYM